MISSRSPFITESILYKVSLIRCSVTRPWGKLGTDLLGTVSGTDLALSGLCLRNAVLPAPSHTDGNAGFSGPYPYFQLGFFILAGNHDTAGDMGQTDCGVSGIDTLTAVSGCTEHVKFAVIHIQVEVDFLCFRHNGHGNGGVWILPPDSVSGTRCTR